MFSRRVYLAGPISGLTYEQSEEWRDDFKAQMPSEIVCYSPLRLKRELLMDKGVIEQSYSTHCLSTDRGIMARDHNDCITSDAVVVNFLNVPRISIGTIMECAWAHSGRIPLIAIMPKGNVHDHPMIREAISFRVDSLEEAISVTKAVLLP